MTNLGWDVQIDSSTYPNTVLGRPVTFKNVIATLDKTVSIQHFPSGIKNEIDNL